MGWDVFFVAWQQLSSCPSVIPSCVRAALQDETTKIKEYITNMAPSDELQSRCLLVSVCLSVCLFIRLSRFFYESYYLCVILVFYTQLSWLPAIAQNININLHLMCCFGLWWDIIKYVFFYVNYIWFNKLTDPWWCKDIFFFFFFLQDSKGSSI